jgi:hypothetical protein
MVESQDQEAIFREFELRSRRRWWMLVPMLIGIFFIAWGRSVPAPVFGLLWLFAGQAGLYIIYRCPACGRSLIRQGSGHCPGCGVRLKRPE